MTENGKRSAPGRWLAIAKRWMDPDTRLLTTREEFCCGYGISADTLEVWVREVRKMEAGNERK